MSELILNRNKPEGLICDWSDDAVLLQTRHPAAYQKHPVEELEKLTVSPN